MFWRFASRLMMWSGLVTALLLVVVAAYFAVFAVGGGLQTDLATDAPPEWALNQYAVLSGLVVLYLLAAVVFTVSLAVVQLKIGPWWAVVGGLCLLAASAGWLLVAGNQTNDVNSARIDALGFVGYMVATNLVGLRSRQFNAVTAGVGLASTLLPLAAAAAAVTGLAGAGVLALALVLYGTWAALLGISEWQRPASGRTRQAPLQAVLQTGPGDR